MAYKIPWSNFHELNLDWLLEQVKKLREDVDNITGSATPYTSTPEMDGVGSPGTEVSYARGDHRHPTDTSRAAATDLAQEILDRGAADDTLQANIDATDAKIKFSSSAPYMDSSSASAGFSDYMARADHVHPTDTSRASATDLATLTARVDAFSGSAAPSDATPLMDGVGAAGTGGNYSRGDHVHPSDTSKFDTAGGTITGNATINGNFKQTKLRTAALLSVTGWYRVANVPNVAGNAVTLHIQRKGISSEIHEVFFAINGNTAAFHTVESDYGLQIITKIRYTSVGALDIYMDDSLTSDVLIEMERFAATEAALEAIHTQAIESVDNNPLGETIIRTEDIVRSESNPFQMALASPDITTFSAYNLTCSSISGFVSLLHNADNSILQMCIRVNLAVTARTGSGGGFEFDLPFNYNGPTCEMDIGSQSQHADEIIYATFTNGSPTVRVRSTESFNNIAAGTIRYKAAMFTLFNRS